MHTRSGSGVSSTPDLSAFVQKSAVRGGQRYYTSGAIASAWLSATMTWTSGRLYATPLLSTRGNTVTSLNIYHTTAAAGKLGRLGIYKADNQPNDLYPASLIVDGGEFGLDVAGLKTCAVSVKLLPNQLYWTVALCNNNVTIRVMDATSMWAINGKWSVTASNAPSSYWYAPQAYGALPVSFPTAGAVAVEANAPFIGVTWS